MRKPPSPLFGPRAALNISLAPSRGLVRVTYSQKSPTCAGTFRPERPSNLSAVNQETIERKIRSDSGRKQERRLKRVDRNEVSTTTERNDPLFSPPSIHFLLSLSLPLSLSLSLSSSLQRGSHRDSTRQLSGVNYVSRDLSGVFAVNGSADQRFPNVDARRVIK